MVFPVSMAKLSNLSYKGLARGPSILYVLILFLVVLILLFAAGLRQISRYDFTKE